jgi:hypothetical protein
MTETESHEHARTDEALETLTRWGRDPGTDGGENIVFGVAGRVRPVTRSWPWGIAPRSLPPGAAGPLLGSRPGPRARRRRVLSASAVRQARRR